MNPSRINFSLFHRLMVAFASLMLLSAVGCGEGEVDLGNGEPDPDVTGDPLDPNDPAFGTGEDWLTLNDLTTDELQLVNLQRDAIDGGLYLGKQALADELNLILEDNGVVDRYAATINSGNGYLAPSPQACPFLEPSGGTGNGLDCRALADRATFAAYAQISSLEAQNPLDTNFDNNRQENEFWYREGITTGMDNEAILALRQIRDSQLCDEDPEPRQSSYEAGVERGRELYVEKVNERFAETGMSGQQYPDQITQVEVCRADRTFLAPARSRAIDEAEQRSSDVPLCPDYRPTNIDDIAALDEANAQYVEGMRRGIDSEDSLASERIFRVVPCNVGDPLVLDVAGDGVNLVPVTESEVEFDLFGMDRNFRTAWIQGDDAFLVLDKDQNGTIDDGRELFSNFIGDRGYNEVPTGFDHLAIYDAPSNGGNNDGLISDRDAIFGQLELWQDNNQDGVSQASELHTLPALGVRAISLGYQPYHGQDRQLTQRATFVRTALGTYQTGSPVGDVYDAWLRYGRAITRR